MQTICVKTKEININDPLFERKIEIATDGLSHDCFNWLYKKVAKLQRKRRDYSRLCHLYEDYQSQSIMSLCHGSEGINFMKSVLSNV